MKFNIKIDSTIRETVNKQFKKNIMTTLKGVNLFKTSNFSFLYFNLNRNLIK